MKHVLRILLLGTAFGFILNGCAKQPETIVVDESPESPAPAAEADDSVVTPATDADFKQLVIGELHPISTLDPLFADNNSMLRTLQLFHEGLVRFDQNGKVVPAIARNWTVSSDSLTYTFTLRDNAFYHDSSVFNNGLGRKVVASDVKFVFERMANNTVPDHAARLFMAIEGFEPYFNEQHEILNPAYRELNGVSGIRTGNGTVQFILIEKDSNFLPKLASPYAVIYPREAVTPSPQNFAAVGAGPFRSSSQRGDSVYIFSKFKGYWQADTSVPVLDRVDVIVDPDEVQLLKSLASNEIHLIPELGPRIMESSLNENGLLQPSYSNRFALYSAGGRTTYSICYNPQSQSARETIFSLFMNLDTEQLVSGIPPKMISVTGKRDSVAETDTLAGAASSASVILSTYTEDPFQHWFMHRISNQWEGRQLQLLQIRTPTRRTALHNGSFVPFYDGHSESFGPNTLIHYSVRQAALSINAIKHLRFNRFPWWIDLRNVELPGVDQL